MPPRSIRSSVLVHWLMLVLFVGWGVFFVYVLVRFRRGAIRAPSYHGVKGVLELHRGGVAGRRSRAARRSSRFQPGRRASSELPSRKRGGRRPRRRRTVRVEHPLSWGRRQVRPHRHQARRPRQSARSRSHRSRRARTTSRRSTSSICRLNRPVIVHLSSKDVIHSFGLPRCA